MNKIYALLLLCVAMLSTQFVQAAEKNNFGIAVYRREQLILPQDGEYRCYELKDAVNDLEKRMKSKIGQLTKRESDLQSKANELNQNDFDKIADLMKEREIIKIDKQILQRQFEQEQMEIGRAFEQKIDSVVSNIRKERKLMLVHALLPGDSADESLDITDEIVERLNEEYRKEQRAKKMKAAGSPAPAPKSLKAA